MDVFLEKKNNVQQQKPSCFSVEKKGIFKNKEISSINSTYKIFNMEELSILTESYSKNRYPTKEKMGQLASTLSQSLDKIRNWFKHQRKKEVQKGTMKYIKKNTFTKKEIEFLKNEYSKKRNPTLEDYEKWAQHLNCQIKNVKNWFSYRRKIFLRQSSGPKPSIEKEMHNKVPTPTEIEKPMFSPVEKSEPINQRNMNSYDNSFGSMGYLNMMPFIGAAQIKNQLVNANLLNWTFNAYNQLIRNQQYFRMINSFLSKN